MRSRWLLVLLGCLFLGATGACTTLLGDFQVTGGTSNGGDASILDGGAGAIDGTTPTDGTAAPDGTARDGTTNSDGNSGAGDATLPADAQGGMTPNDASGDAGGIVLTDAQCTAATVGALCSPPTCLAGSATAPGTCLADGTCQIPPSTTCSPYVCGASSCMDPCAVDADCVPGYVCTSGACVAPKSQGGSPCTRDAECQPGLSCSPEGICCNAPCNGACQLCNSAGMCEPVPAMGQPRPGHPTCTNGGTAPCGGYCDGTDIGCFYPTTACRTATCGCFPANGCTASPTQNCANGSCPNPIYTPCNGFACDSTGTVCGDTCDPVAGSGCYGFNCCHTVFTGACFHSCTSTCPASGTCE